MTAPSRRRVTAAILGALAVLAGALFLAPAFAADSGVPGYLTDGLAECQAQQSVAVSLDEKAWADHCVTLAQRALDAYVAAHPTPTTAPPTVDPTTDPPATTPPATTPPATTPPVTTPPVTPTSPGTVTHGRDITTANTGYAAWTGPAGEHCTNATQTVYTTRKSVTDFPVNSLTGRAFTCVWFKAGLVVDATATVTAGRFTGAGPGGANAVQANTSRISLNWSTVDGSGFNCEIGIVGHVSILRTQVTGCSDGVRFEGTDVVESWIRTRSLSAADHNDGIQAYMAGEGGNILRSNIDSRPVNGNAFGTAAIFLADDSRGLAVIRDNLLAGGNGTLRLHEAMTYRVTGNRVVDGSWQSQTGPYSNDAQVPGAVLEWADNTTTTGAPFGP